MAKKILLVFSGTGGSAAYLHQDYEHGNFNDDVVRIYFNGCQDSTIGGARGGMGFINPNLDIVGRKIRQSFNNDGNLSLTELKRQFDNAIVIEPHDTAEDLVEVDTINLNGFSRGGVTTFAVARHLDDLNKPINLFSMEPVPGDSKYSAKKSSSEFFKNYDLRACKNLNKAEIVLGVYKRNVNPLHNKFFRQMAPLFAES